MALILIGSATIYIIWQLKQMKLNIQEVNEFSHHQSQDPKYRHENSYDLGDPRSDRPGSFRDSCILENEYAIPYEEPEYDTTYPYSKRGSEEKCKDNPTTVNKFHTEKTEERLSICGSNIDFYVPN